MMRTLAIASSIAMLIIWIWSLLIPIPLGGPYAFINGSLVHDVVAQRYDGSVKVTTLYRTKLMPIWLPCLIAAAGTGWSLIKNVRVKRDDSLCANCSYDLTGNVSGVCSECGNPIATMNPPKLGV